MSDVNATTTYCYSFFIEKYDKDNLVAFINVYRGCIIVVLNAVWYPRRGRKTKRCTVGIRVTIILWIIDRVKTSCRRYWNNDNIPPIYMLCNMLYIVTRSLNQYYQYIYVYIYTHKVKLETILFLRTKIRYFSYIRICTSELENNTISRQHVQQAYTDLN